MLKIKKSRNKKLKNALLFKKSGYSIAITAIFLAGVIVLNVLVSALSQRFNLDIDMTADQKHTVSQENIDYIKSVDKSVDIIVCSPEDSYADNVMSLLNQAGMITSSTDTGTYYEYFEQTMDFVNKYAKYNSNFNLKFVDTQSTEFTEIGTKYSLENPQVGAIIVGITNENDVVRRKVLGVTDIYVLQEDSSSYYYTGTTSSIVGNDIETALTSAIAYVTTDIDTKVAFLTGHSKTDLTADYKELLTKNNFEVTDIEDTVISEISNEYDIIVIAGASRDFTEDEIKVLSAFLDNDGALGKGMMVFADATAKYLDNFYDFLSEWGIEIEEGILYETNSQYYIPGDNTTLLSQNTWVDTELYDIGNCWTGNNVPMKATAKDMDYMKASAIVSTVGESDVWGETEYTAIAAPKNRKEDWDSADKYTAGQHATLIESIKSNNDADGEDIETRVAVFSSTDFIYSEYSEIASVTNKEATLAMVERAAGITNTGINFIAKSISASESFYSSVTEFKSNLVKNIFMFLVPIAVIALGTVIYIRRRNA